LPYKIIAGATLLCAAIIGLLAVYVEEPPVASSGPRIRAQLEREFSLGDSPAREPRFSPDGRLLALSNASGDVFILSSDDWRLVRRIRHSGGATSLAFSPDGHQLYTAGYDGVVRGWDLEHARFAGKLGSPGATIWSLDISPDGRRLAAAGEDKIVRLWDLASQRAAGELRGHARNIWQVRFSPAGDRLATGSFDYSARIWNSRSGQAERELRGHTQAVVGLAYSPDGATIATSGDDSTIRLWRASDGAALRTVRAGNHTYTLNFSPDGQWLLSGGRGRSAVGTAIYQMTGLGRRATPVHIWRVADGALVAALPDETDVFQAAIAPDGRHLAVADDSGRVRLWRVSGS